MASKEAQRTLSAIAVKKFRDEGGNEKAFLSALSMIVDGLLTGSMLAKVKKMDLAAAGDELRALEAFKSAMKAGIEVIESGEDICKYLPTQEEREKIQREAREVTEEALDITNRADAAMGGNTAFDNLVRDL